MSGKRNKGLQFYRKKKKINKAIVKEIMSWIIIILIAVFLAIVSNFFYGTTIPMVGISMEPGIYNEQRVFVDKFCYVLGSPSKGDIVAFLPNGNQNSHYYIKRVVGVPGDTISSENGILLINGEVCPYLTDKLQDVGIAASEFTLENGTYFLLGDNPNSSEDSRSANIGPVDMDCILGRVWFKLSQKEHKMGFVLDKVPDNTLEIIDKKE